MKLTYEQMCRIWNQEVGENTYILDLIPQIEEVQENMKLSSSYRKALEYVDVDPVWKDFMNDAEMEAGVTMAYKIYKAVKQVVEEYEKAIEEGIKAADEGKVETLENVKEKWKNKRSNS